VLLLPLPLMFKPIDISSPSYCVEIQEEEESVASHYGMWHSTFALTQSQSRVWRN
jgi:hypothetical protein